MLSCKINPGIERQRTGVRPNSFGRKQVDRPSTFVDSWRIGGSRPRLGLRSELEGVHGKEELSKDGARMVEVGVEERIGQIFALVRFHHVCCGTVGSIHIDHFIKFQCSSCKYFEFASSGPPRPGARQPNIVYAGLVRVAPPAVDTRQTALRTPTPGQRQCATTWQHWYLRRRVPTQILGKYHGRPCTGVSWPQLLFLLCPSVPSCRNLTLRIRLSAFLL